MWVQFRGILFYLLTKQLARELGEQVGTTLMIDANARGNICDKFVRARVLLPLYSALQRWITLADEITGEKVKVSIRYERLPNFSLFCGFIGHMEVNCDLHVAVRKVNYGMELRVLPVHFDDPRKWYLANTMGQARPHHLPSQPWRAAKPTEVQQVVEEVVKEVAKLSVEEGKGRNIGKTGDSAAEEEANATEDEAKGDTNKKEQIEEKDAGGEVAASNEPGKEIEGEETSYESNSTNQKSMKRWKRKNREDPEIAS